MKNFFLFLSLFLPILIYNRTLYDTSLFTAYIAIISLLIIFVNIILIKKIDYTLIKYIVPFFLLYIAGMTTTIFRGSDELVNIFNRSMPVLFFCAGYILITSYNLLGNNNKYIIKLFFYLSILSTAYTLIFAINYYGFTLVEARYQVLPNTINFLISFFFASYILSIKKFNGYLCLLFFITVVLISATRTYLLVGIIVLFISILFKNKLDLVKTFFTFFSIAFIVGIILFIFKDNLLIVSFYERIILYQSLGYDPTTAGRLFEMSKQLDMLTNEISGFLFGYGFTHPIDVVGFGYDVRGNISAARTHGYGHNLYVGLLFVPGVLVGLSCVYVLISSLVSIKFLFIKNLISSNNIDSDEKFVKIFFYLSFLFFLLQNIFGVTLGSKPGSLYFGICLGAVRIIFKEKKIIDSSN